MTNTTTERGQITFEAPGPGEWMLDSTHHGRRPLSGYLRPISAEAYEGMAVLFRRYGLPLAGMDVRHVHGLEYIRPRAVGDSGKGSAPPPTWLMKIVARVHPELRRRNRAASEAWRDRAWREDVDRWFDGERARVIEANRSFQQVDLAALDDGALVRQLAELTSHMREQARAGFATHGGDIIPVGDYLAHCAEWGIAAPEASALLRGSSPASMETARLLAPVAQALAAGGGAVGSIEEVRGLGAACAEAIDEWLALHAWRVISSDDLDAATLAESPALQLAALRSAVEPVEAGEVDVSAVRDKVPPAQRALFDELLTEARYGLRLRDDNVGVRWNWPAGLLRRALLEVGRRLVTAGRLEDAGQAIELDASEVSPLLLRGDGPSAAEVAARHRVRFAVEAAGPPSTLGEPEPPPPFEALPAPMARAARAVLALIGAMEGEPGAGPLRGVGIGDRVYRGRARLVVDATDALERIEPGDVLVTSFTGPSYNSLLPILGAVVVEEGGPMCHAAIVAREFGLPAVVGATGVMSLLHDGDQIEVDPVAGEIRVIS